MILTVLFLVGMLTAYLTLGLASGRAYFILKLKQWHNLTGVRMRTQRQIEQEDKLNELEAKAEYEKKMQDRNNERLSLMRALDAAKDACEELEKERLNFLNQIERHGRDAYVIKVESFSEDLPMQIYDHNDPTLGQKYDEISAKLVQAKQRLKRANQSIDKFDQRRRRNWEGETWHDYKAYGSRYVKSYEDERDKFKKEINPYAITMVFLWPIMASWFIGQYAVKHAIRFGDKVLHADTLGNYVSPEEHKLEARIKALTEKDPELAKMYAELAKTLEA